MVDIEIDDVFVKRTVNFFVKSPVYDTHMDDLYQCGRIAFARAKTKYDPSKLTPFETYCRTVIRNDLWRLLKKINKSLFREVPSGSLNDFAKLCELRNMTY